MISTIDAPTLERRISEFAELLHACVRAGASIGFVLPHPIQEAMAFWRDGVGPALRGGKRLLLAAEIDGRLVGTVQLDHDTPPNQPHRAEIRKLLVHPHARRHGLARRLMARVEDEARARGRTLLVLDTRTGDAAEPLYRSLGYSVVGSIPGYCLAPDGGALDATTIMFKSF
jgi:ribosomal protein S18 acetylase RimI-like enzyme